MNQKRFITLLLSFDALLLIPFMAMQFTDEVQWSLFDFLIMGLLLSLLAVGVETVLSRVQDTKMRVLVLGAVGLGFLLLWAELAVGIFGTPFAGS